MVNRTKRTVMNYFSDVIPFIVALLISVYKIPLFIEYLGVELQGVVQLYNQIFMYLTLLDAGVATAIMYILYEYVKSNNQKRINEVLSGTRIIFYVVAAAFFLVGIIISFCLNVFIKDVSLDYSYLQTVFILYLLSNIIPYFFIAYNIIFDVNQQKYQTNIIIQSMLIIRGIADIVLILLGYDLIVISAFRLITTLIVQVIIRARAIKKFPSMDLNVSNKDYSGIKHVKEILPSKIATLIINNIDILIISAYLRLRQVAIYGVYNYLILNIKQIINKLFLSSLSSVGNLVVGDKSVSYKFFKEFFSTLFFVGTIVFVPLYLVLNPFIVLWVGEDLLVNNLTSLFFCLTLLMAVIRIPVSSYITVFGLFKQSKKAAYIEGTINLIATLICVQYWGILGALASTIGAYLISDIFQVRPLYVEKFNVKIIEY